MSRVAYRILALVFLGTFLLQSAWILTLPPFRGLDEFDHAYRATAVANGEWLPEAVAPENGRGFLVTATNDIVDAAGPECAALPYTGPDNCTAVDDVGDGLVTVGSGAARYHPAHYWVMGKSAALFEGAHALYAMRLSAALLCAGFVTLAMRNLMLWSRTRWPSIALLASMTPVLVYSTATAAPNGVEMAAGLSLWTALLGFARRDLSPRVEGALLWATVPGGVVLTTVRSLGPLWLLLVVLTAVAALGVPRVRSVIAGHRIRIGVIAAILVGATLACVWWIRASGTVSRITAGEFEDPLTNTFRLSFLWFFQAIGAFPSRDEPAPMLVYATYIVVVVALLGLGFQLASRRVRGSLLLAIAVSYAVPFLLTLATYSAEGSIWQGRYGLPYSVGVFLLAGLALDRANPRHRLLGPAFLCGWLCLLVAHTVGVVNVLINLRATSPSAGGPAWLMPEPWQVVLLTVLGWLALTHAVRRSVPPSAAGVAVVGNQLDRELLEEQADVGDDAARL